MEARIFNNKRWNNNVSNFLIYISGIKFFSSAGPKSYYAIDHNNDKFKRSSKGVQHRIKLTYDEFKDVVYKSRRIEVENPGIRLKNGKMSTICQTKTGMRNVFVKSYVEKDCISLRPFDKFLC